MASAATLADDILVTLGYDHDDRARGRENVIFNIGLAINRLRAISINKDTSKGRDAGLMNEATIYKVPVSREDTLCDRAYFTLPAPIIDASINGGVAYIRYCSDCGCDDGLLGRPFAMGSPNDLSTASGMEWAKPSPAFPWYFRARYAQPDGPVVTDRVWLVGISPLIECVETGLYLSVDTSSPMADPDAELSVDDDQLYIIKRMVLDMERFALLVPQQRWKNDGRDFPPGQQPLQPPHMVSVNDPVNTSLSLD